jgi:hypothetical protein
MCAMRRIGHMRLMVSVTFSSSCFPAKLREWN